MTTSGAVIRQAGASMFGDLSGASITVSGAGTQLYVDYLIDKAESFVNAATRKNWTTVFSGLNVEVREILTDTVSKKAGIGLIKYDMGGYTSRGEAESMITILRDDINTNISLLRDKKTESFMNGA